MVAGGSLAPLDGLSAVIYATEASGTRTTYLVSSRITPDWRVTLSCDPSTLDEDYWWECQTPVASADALLGKVDRPPGTTSALDAVIHHFTQGGLSVARHGSDGRTLRIGSERFLTLTLVSLREASLLSVIKSQWRALYSATGARLSAEMELRSLRQMNDPGLLAERTSENKRLAALVEKLELEKKTLQAYVSGDGGSSPTSVKRGGPLPAKKIRGEPNLMAPGRALATKIVPEFASSEEDELPGSKRKRDSETEEE